MPYSVITKDNIQIDNIPDHLAPDSPEVKARVFAVRARARTSTPEFQAKVLAQQEADRALYNPTSGMSGLDKVRANLGAGMMDLVQGAKQLGADWFGSEEDSRRAMEDTNDKRALDRNLAQNTTGGTALQIAGSVIPTLAIPTVGVAQRVSMLPRAAGIAIDGGLAGGAYGALAPVGEGESRGRNTATGAALGTVLPLAVSGVRRGWQAGRERLTTAGRAERAERRATQQIAEEVAGQGAPQNGRRAALEQTVARLRGTPQQTGPIPLSTAAQLGDEQLARLEAGSRAQNGANWYGFDTDQARALSTVFDRATSEVGELAARRGSRQANYVRNWDWAKQGLSQPRFDAGVQALTQHLDDALVSGASSNPAVRAMLQEVRNEIDRLGPRFGPDNLKEIRANLSGRGNKMSGGPLAQAPRDAPATHNLLETIDGVLDDATNQRWRAVNENYAADSVRVRQATAAGRARNQYYDPDSGRVRGVAADHDPTLPNVGGDIPKITEAGIGRAMDSGLKRGTQELSPQAVQEMEAILSALRQQGIVQRVKRSATAGGGSNTASDLMAAQAARQFGNGVGAATANPVGAVAADIAAGAVQRNASRADALRDEVLARALQNPDEMLQLLERQLQRGETLPPLSQQLYEALRQRLNRTP